MRYVDEAAPLDDSDEAELGPGAWRGTVQLTYRNEGFDTAPARLETAATFVPTGGKVRIASFGGPGERTPLWLVEPLSVVRTPRTLLAVAGSSPGRYPGLVTKAVQQVTQVLPDWKGRLQVEVPASEDELNAAVDAQPGEYDNIAAVTTTADGSLAPDAPVRVFVNPQVFDHLKQRGAQVVMSHESTHVATDAPFATMPTWLLEGFADFVALDHAGVPVDKAAGQILPRIRKEGLPDRLADQPGSRPDRQRARCHLRGGMAGLPLPGPGVRRAGDGALLPHGQRGCLDAAGVPDGAAHHAAGLRDAVAHRPRPPCRGGRLGRDCQPSSVASVAPRSASQDGGGRRCGSIGD